MIKRNGPGDYERATKHFTQRKMEDFDFRFTFEESTCSIYVLGEGEWYDPHTSTKYTDGVSPHAMRGPSVIVLHESKFGRRCSDEYHVNDPRVWAWIQQNIADGLFGKENCQVVGDYQAFEIRPEPKKVRAKKQPA